MRVSSLSDKRVIRLISKYFVPVSLSNDNYQLNPRSKEEEAEWRRIDTQRRQRDMDKGTVCAIVYDTKDGVLATQRVQWAYKPEKLIPFLRKIIAGRKLTPRSAEAIRTTAARPAKAEAKTEGGRLVHILTRRDQIGQNRGVGNDRVELTAAECQAFAPPAKARRGTTWKIPDDIARKLFRFCYPPTPHWDAKESKVLRAKLTATLVSVSATEVRIRLTGATKVIFPYTGKPNDGRVSARFVGVARFQTKTRKFTSLALVADRADYVWYWKGEPQPAPMRIALEMEP